MTVWPFYENALLICCPNSQNIATPHQHMAAKKIISHATAACLTGSQPELFQNRHQGLFNPACCQSVPPLWLNHSKSTNGFHSKTISTWLVFACHQFFFQGSVKRGVFNFVRALAFTPGRQTYFLDLISPLASTTYKVIKKGEAAGMLSVMPSLPKRSLWVRELSHAQTVQTTPRGKHTFKY